MRRLTLPVMMMLAIAIFSGVPRLAKACEVKVGILHSLSGGMALSETTLKEAMEMMIDQANSRGGVLGCEIVPVIKDPASDWPRFATLAEEMLVHDNVAAIFGAWTSVSRKEILPVVERYNGLLFYPVQYEGEESSPNVFYTGAAPNQQAIPATDYMIDELGRDTFVLLGTDYVYPRTTNRILEGYLLKRGISTSQIFVNYTPFGFQDWAPTIAYLQMLKERGRNVGVISTINGDANVHFYKALAAAGLSSKEIPVIAFSVGEAELAAFKDFSTQQALEGHLAAWNYFQSVDTPINKRFIEQWRLFKGDKMAVTSDPIEAHFIGFHMWLKAVEKAGTTDVDAVRSQMHGMKMQNLTGGMAEMLPNHHITKPVLIGRIKLGGQFEILKQTEMVPGDAWTDHLPMSAKLKSDWVDLKCGKFDTVVNRCVQYR